MSTRNAGYGNPKQIKAKCDDDWISPELWFNKWFFDLIENDQSHQAEQNWFSWDK